LVIPLAIIIQIFVSQGNVQASLFSAGLWIYPILSFGIIISLFVQVLGIFINGLGYTRKIQKQHRQRRGAKTAEEWDEIIANNGGDIGNNY
jgi:hypothetical protein